MRVLNAEAPVYNSNQNDNTDEISDITYKNNNIPNDFTQVQNICESDYVENQLQQKKMILLKQFFVCKELIQMVFK